MKDYSCYLPLLRIIQNSNGPVGASTLKDNPALDMSQATIGRQLAVLQQAGFLKKVSNKGRALTQQGLDYIHYIDDNTNKTRIAKELAALSTADNPEPLIQILDLRLLLEPYAASQAAVNATASDIRDIENLVFVHRYKLCQGEAAHLEDLHLHLRIAKVCKNIMLQKILELLLTENNAYVEFSLAGDSQRDRQIQYHFQILEAIQNHDAENAKKAMENHLRHVTSDVHQYFSHNPQHI